MGKTADPQPAGISFNPAANKKKIKTGNQKMRMRSAKEKKERIWGKTPQKPYISSSMGDMARVMMRYACMENTYFYNTEPPPVEFYDYWQKFSVDAPKYPNQFVDKKKASIANIKKNTSSFDFFNTYTVPIRSRQTLEDSAAGTKQKKTILTADAQNISDIWQNVRISMSTESFISSSTKISENASAVGMEVGWDDACSEDYQSSESDFGLDVLDKCRHHRHRQHHQWALGLEALLHPPEVRKRSSVEFHTAQGLIDKQANAITQEILALQKKDNRIIYELATQPHDLDIIDHFADDIDDSFLLDSYSYSDLPDETFGPDFDFLNEDALNKKKGKKGKKPAGEKKRKAKKGGKSAPASAAADAVDSDEDDTAPDTTHSGALSCVESIDENCKVGKGGSKRGKKGSRKSRDGRPGKSEKDGNESSWTEGQGYDACMERRRKRIEEVLKAAVRSRSPMGSFRPKEGEEPLSRYKEHSSPGPAAYNPNIFGTKPNVYGVFLAPRWTKDIYETPGPGPCAYIPTNKCTCEMLTLHETPRFPEDETVGPGPAFVNLAAYGGTAKGKPGASIVGRRNKDRPDVFGQFTNTYGWTRFGKANPPNPVIISRHEPREKGQPGPGKYKIKDDMNRRIGISIKSRIPSMDEYEQSPPFYNPPPLFGTGPSATFGIREFMERKDQSPGPIYKLPDRKLPGISLTFRPFPISGAEDEPSPLEWGTTPGEGKIKTLPRAPEHVLLSRWKTFDRNPTPGPNQYDVCHDCEECIWPGATLAGRYPTKVDRLPGPGDYRVKPFWRRAPAACFTHPKPEKEKPVDNRRYGYPPKPKIIGAGIMTARWSSNKKSEERGPPFVNIFGFTNRGNKTSRIPITFKSRHTPFKYSHIADPKQVPYDNADCRSNLKPVPSPTKCKANN